MKAWVDAWLEPMIVVSFGDLLRLFLCGALCGATVTLIAL